jgi:hypothetical protein
LRSNPLSPLSLVSAGLWESSNYKGSEFVFEHSDFNAEGYSLKSWQYPKSWDGGNLTLEPIFQ